METYGVAARSWSMRSPNTPVNLNTNTEEVIYTYRKNPKKQAKYFSSARELLSNKTIPNFLSSLTETKLENAPVGTKFHWSEGDNTITKEKKERYKPRVIAVYPPEEIQRPQGGSSYTGPARYFVEKIPVRELYYGAYNIGEPQRIGTFNSIEEIPQEFKPSSSFAAELESAPSGTVYRRQMEHGGFTLFTIKKVKYRQIAYESNNNVLYSIRERTFDRPASTVSVVERFNPAPSQEESSSVQPNSVKSMRKKNRSTRYKMANTRRNRRNTRKNRKNNVSATRKNEMLGGKRRKGGRKSHRKSRKGRKGSRKH